MRKAITTIVLLSLLYPLLAQRDNIGILWKSKIEIADQLYEDRLYSEALNDYLEVAFSTELSDENNVNLQPDLTLKIADCLYKLRRLPRAIQYYKMTIEEADTAVYQAVDLLHYAECLLFDEKVEEAKTWYNTYYLESKSDLGKERFRGTILYEDLLASKKPTILSKWANNGAYAEIVPVVYQNKLYYSSYLPSKSLADRDYLMGDMEVFSLLVEDSLGTSPVTLPKNLFNVSSPTFADDNQVILSASKKGDDRLKLFQGVIKSPNKWSGFKELDLHDTSGIESIISASLSALKDTLYFSSNRLNGFGGFDIYYTTQSDSGWSRPINMGPFINTQADELYPLSRFGKLYFTSNGHPGLGGLDIYYAKNDQVTNLAAPINSSQDDFAIYYTDPYHGYFSSNRKGGSGKDDLYQFVQTENPQVNLSMVITRKWGGSPIREADILLTALDDSHQLKGVSLPDGSFENIVHTRTKYLLTIDKKGQIPINDTIQVLLQDLAIDYEIDELFTFQAFVFAKASGAALSRPIIFVEDIETGISHEVQGNETGFFEIKKPTSTTASLLITREGYAFATDTITFEQEEFSKTYSLAKVKPAGTLTLKDLLYELDQHQLKSDYVPILDSIATSLKKFRNLRIIVESHTDSRGSIDYNLELSQKRAESVRDYLISQGVSPNSVGAVGKGESELLNKCKDGIRCSDEEHKVNRRTEIKLYRSE